MCDICQSAELELEQFLTELENKFPGGEVEGKKVPRGHHATVATMVQAQKRLYTEVTELDKLYPPSPADTQMDNALRALFAGSPNISEGN